jgi:hypothetical protein
MVACSFSMVLVFCQGRRVIENEHSNPDRACLTFRGSCRRAGDEEKDKEEEEEEEEENE